MLLTHCYMGLCNSFKYNGIYYTWDKTHVPPYAGSESQSRLGDVILYQLGSNLSDLKSWIPLNIQYKLNHWIFKDSNLAFPLCFHKTLLIYLVLTLVSFKWQQKEHLFLGIKWVFDKLSVFTTFVYELSPWYAW